MDAFDRDDIATLRELYRQRCDLMAARTRLELQIMAIARRIAGTKVPLKTALGLEYIEATIGLVLPYRQIQKLEKQAEKALLKAAKALPEFELIVGMRGFGPLTFAAVVAECGDLRAYSTQGKLWKRMGLGLVNGARQRKCKDPELAALHGYSPRRRAIMYNFSESAIKVGGPYADLYRQRKAYEIARNPEIKPIHAHKRAQRYIAKQALRDLWKAWRAAHAEARAAA